MTIAESPTQEQRTLASSCCTPGALALPGAEVVERTAEVFKAIGHPVRLQILLLLGQSAGPVCVCDIEQPFSIKQPTISHHLKVLREAGLVETEQRGTWVYYRLRTAAIRSIEDFLNRMAD